MATEKNWTTVTVVWMGLAALAMGAFWHGWNLVFGQIPVLETVTMFPEIIPAGGVITEPAWILTLPFGLSRSWDMLGAAAFVWLGFRFCRWAETKNRGQESLAFGLVGGLVAGLVGGLVGGLAFGLVFGLVGGLGFGLVGGLGFGLGFGLGYSFIVGLFWLGLGPGLAVFVVITAPLWLVVGSAGAYRAIKRRSRADWSGVKALLSGGNGNSGS